MSSLSISLGKLVTKYTGKIFTIYEQEVHFPNGETKLYEYCERPSSVSVLAFDEQNRLLLIREHRIGYKNNVWFLPGGRVDHKGESPRTAAIRELQEEAGFKPKTIKLLYKKSPSNTLKWDIYIFVAKNLVPSFKKGDEEFPIEVVPTTLAKAVRMAKDGTIENEFIAYTIIRFAEMLKKGEFVW
jgi:ADP-ribose pyrophosphatase